MPDDYVVIDIETTGIYPDEHEIIELAAIKVSDNKPVSEFQSLVNPRCKIDAFISKLTGITNDMVLEKPYIEDILPTFLAFLGDSHYVGHNVHFDINFIYDNAIRCRLPVPTNDLTNTVRLARRAFPDLPNHKLDTVAERCGVSAEGHHRALADCYITNGCYQNIKQVYTNSGVALYEHKPALSAKTFSARIPVSSENSPFFGQSFVFTGTLQLMTRAEAMQLVVDAGGICMDRVTRKTNYLVVDDINFTPGAVRSAKQEKALKCQAEGITIEIIPESVFYDMFGILYETKTKRGIKLFPMIEWET
ncbi:MAG: exonuclease domain-containing protein [Bacteroides sp.]